MSLEPRSKSKFCIEAEPTYAIITLPFHKNYYAIIVMPLTWVGMLFFEFDYIWFFFGLPVLFAIVNMMFGKEIITVDKTLLVQEYKIGNFTLTKKEYTCKFIKNMKVSSGDYIDRHYSKDLEIRLWGPETGRISFNYGKDTFTILGDIEEAEGEDLLKLLKSYII